MGPSPGFLVSTLELHPEAWVAPGAILVGSVRLGARASVWYGCVVRGDLEAISIGEETNVQDLSVIHVDRGYPAVLGDRVTVGHRAVIHGCRIEDEAVIGMGAVVLTGAKIGRGALIAAGAVVLEGFEAPEGAVVAGVPAKTRGRVSAELRERFLRGVESYVELAAAHRGDASRGPREAGPGR